MIRALTTSATGMAAQQYNLEVIANNLANVNTTAYKSQSAEFQDLMYQTYRSSGASANGSLSAPTPVQVGLGAKFSANHINNSQGAMQATSNPLDMAIQGDGYFRITAPNGKDTYYSRDGSFTQDVNGQLVTSDGNPLADDITVPQGTSAISISASGIVSGILPGDNQSSQIGQIQLAVFANPAGLTRVGNNLYAAGGASGSPTDTQPGQNGAGQIQANALEGSNVQVVDEMVAMISAQRAYELNSKAVQTADQMLSTLSNLKQ